MIFPLYDDNPTRRSPLLTVAPIGATTAFFLAAMSTDNPDAPAADAWNPAPPRDRRKDGNKDR